MTCKEAIAELMQSIDANAPTSEEARAHLRECERGRALLTSVSEQVPAEDAAIDSSAIAIGAAIIVSGLLMLIPLRRGGGIAVPELAIIAFAGICIAIIVGAPLLILFSTVANAKASSGERRFYKRLGPGRWIEGVCLGIAEAMGWNVAFVRIAFALLVWFKGLGLLAYIVCALAMPVHPADRRYLLRFRIARAWRRMRHAADDAQQQG